MTFSKWLALGLGVALILAGLGAALVYFVRTSSDASWAAYRKHDDSLAIAAQALQRHQDSALAQALTLLQSGSVHASQGQTLDTVVKLDSSAVSGLRWDLALAQTALDSLLHYPPLVASQDTQITDLSLSRNSWRSAFNDQAQANASLVQIHAGDTLFRAELLAQMKALPKPPRTGLLGFLLRPKPYLKGGYRSGGFLEAGVCWGC